MVKAPIPAAPKGAGPAGRRLWRAVLADFDLDEHELTLLRQAAATADVCADLQAVVDSVGPLTTSVKGDVRANPALVELRNQRILLARLIVALRVPLGETDEPEGKPRTQYRGTRGAYLRGVS